MKIDKVHFNIWIVEYTRIGEISILTVFRFPVYLKVGNTKCIFGLIIPRREETGVNENES